MLDEQSLASSPLLHCSSLGDSCQSFLFLSPMTKAHGSCLLTLLHRWLLACRCPAPPTCRVQWACRLGTEHTHLPLSQHTKKVLCGDLAEERAAGSAGIRAWRDPSNSWPAWHVCSRWVSFPLFILSQIEPILARSTLKTQQPSLSTGPPGLFKRKAMNYRAVVTAKSWPCLRFLSDLGQGSDTNLSVTTNPIFSCEGNKSLE